jgi:hypothetical protein
MLIVLAEGTETARLGLDGGVAGSDASTSKGGWYRPSNVDGHRGMRGARHPCFASA